MFCNPANRWNCSKFHLTPRNGNGFWQEVVVRNSIFDISKKPFSARKETSSSYVGIILFFIKWNIVWNLSLDFFNEKKVNILSDLNGNLRRKNAFEVCDLKQC